MTTERIACDECGRRVNEFHSSRCSRYQAPDPMWGEFEELTPAELDAKYPRRYLMSLDQPKILGYTVVAERPGRTSSEDMDREIVGSVHLTREPAENHRAWCEGMAPDGLDTFGNPVTYRVVEVRVAT